MKARLIRDGKHQNVLLCEDGTIAKATTLLLYDLFVDFKRTDDFFTGDFGRWDVEYPEMSLYPGENIAILADNYSLIIYDPTPFQDLLNNKIQMRDYVSASEFAKKYDKSIEIIKVYCRTGRIPGAKKNSREWLIPADAKYPVAEERRREGSKGPRPHTRKAYREKIQNKETN